MGKRALEPPIRLCGISPAWAGGTHPHFFNMATSSTFSLPRLIAATVLTPPLAHLVLTLLVATVVLPFQLVSYAANEALTLLAGLSFLFAVIAVPVTYIGTLLVLVPYYLWTAKKGKFEAGVAMMISLLSVPLVLILSGVLSAFLSVGPRADGEPWSVISRLLSFFLPFGIAYAVAASLLFARIVHRREKSPLSL